MTTIRTASVLTLSALSLILLDSTAVAQDTGDGALLDEVTVTAQRREQNIQETPVSITAFTPDRLDELGIHDPIAMMDFVPNATVSSGTGRGGEVAQFSIRGVNEARVSPVLDPGVAIYVDDVYYGRPQVGFLQFVDTERVEILRGPQGTLFGKNSTGGAIRYITKKPDLDGNNGYIDITVGDYERLDVKGAFNAVLSDSTAVRVSAGSFERDGYVRRLADGINLGNQDARAAQLQLRHSPSDSLTVDLRADYSQSTDNNGAVKLIDYFNFNTDQDIPNPGGPVRDGSHPSSSALAAWNYQWGGTAMEYAPEIPRSLYEVAGTGLIPWTDNESSGLTMDISWDFSENTSFRSITGYRDMTSTAFRDPDDVAHAKTFFDDYYETFLNFWSQEFQLNGTSFDDRLNWVAGVFYSSEENGVNELEDRDGRSTARYGALMVNDNSLQDTTSLGVFAQGTFDISDAFAVTAGVRYTEDDKNFTVRQTAFWDAQLDQMADDLGLADIVPPNYNGCDPSVSPSCVVNPGVSGGDTFDAVTPRLSLEWHPMDDVMLYGSYSAGFKAGGTNDALADINVPFDEEMLDSYEIGIRSTFADGRIRANLTAFTMDYENKQITVTSSPLCASRCTANVGDGKIDGWEFDGMAAITDNLIWNIAVGILDARWDDITNPSAGVTPSSPFSAAPDLTWNTGLRWVNDLNNGAQLVSSLDYAYTDKHATSPQDTTTLYMPEYDLVNFRVKWISPEGDYEVSVFCSNCTDEKYVRAGNGWAGGTWNTFFPYKEDNTPPYTANSYNPLRNAAPGITIVHVGAPRMIGAQFRYNFGDM